MLLILSSYYAFLCAAPFTDPSSNPTSMFNYLKKFLPDAPIILEAGANLGEDTKIMKSIWPQAKLHVFEPLPWSFKKMASNVEHLDNVVCYECALSTYSGTADFFVDIPNNGASSLLRPVDFNRHEFDPQPITVKCTTIDTWAHGHNVKHIDFMWLDMEGYELFALQNGLSILDTVRVIYTEVNYQLTREGTSFYHDLRPFLESHGFVEIWKEGEHGRFGNALFVKQKLLRNI